MARKTITVPEAGTVPNFYRVELTVTEDMLGTAPANAQIYTDYIASKALKAEKKLAVTEDEKAAVAAKQDAITKEELAMLPEDNQKGVTVFRRGPDGSLVLTDTMIRGFLKEGAAAIGVGGSSWGLTTKIDRFIYVTDENKRPIRQVPLLRDGKPVTQPDGIYERPLRAQTMQGPRVTLAASEIVKAPFTLNFFVTVVGLGTSEKGRITPDVLRSWFEFGMYTGLGQYRTGGHGRFDAVIEAL